MLKQLPLWAAVMTLCACSSPPTVLFPTGSGQRLPINGAIRSADSPYLHAQRPPGPIEARRFTVEPQADTVMTVVAQWARRANLRLDWVAATDYPVTPRILDIRERTVETALGRLGAALSGVERPLDFNVKNGVLAVREAGQDRPSPATAEPSEAPTTTTTTPADAPATACDTQCERTG